MNGARSLLATASAAGIRVCFVNPGTTELTLVDALSSVPQIRSVLALFEGVVTGAADGYGRMTGQPALTMSHLGPSFANGIANLHNARRARTPIVNLVGDHPTWHRSYDPPLASDIGALASSVSGWVQSVPSAARMSAGINEAIRAARKGQIATLVVPADCQWDEAPAPEAPLAVETRPAPDGAAIDRARAALGEASALLIGGAGLTTRGLRAAGRIAAATRCRLIAETFPARLECGRGTPIIERMPYVPRTARASLGSLKQLVLVGAQAPVAFFAEHDRLSSHVPEALKPLVLAQPLDDIEAALELLADALRAPPAVADRPTTRPAVMPGALTVPSIMSAIAANQPEGMILVDEGVSAGGAYLQFAPSCPSFSYLTLTGGAIGYGLPCATGAAIACPDRKVVAIVGDGAASYTVQSLWTHAREQLDIVTIVLANDAYRILEREMTKVSSTTTNRLFELTGPKIGWPDLAKGYGVPATTVETGEQLSSALRIAMPTRGPHMIVARL